MCIAPPVRSGLIRRHSDRRQAALLLVVLIRCYVIAACTGQAPVANNVTVDLTLRPVPPVAGAASVGEMALRDRQRRLMRGATVHVVAQMSHPGMRPVIATIQERPDGLYNVDLEFTMAGDWVVHVTGALPDGRPLDAWLDVPGVRSAD